MATVTDKPLYEVVNGRRVEILDEDEQLAWLARKGEQHGFRLTAARASAGVPNVRAVYENKVAGRRRSADDSARGVMGVGPYVLATALALVSPYVTLGICALVAGFYALPIASGGEG